LLTAKVLLRVFSPPTTTEVWDSTSPRSSSLIAHDGAEVQWLGKKNWECRSNWVKIQDYQASTLLFVLFYIYRIHIYIHISNVLLCWDWFDQACVFLTKSVSPAHGPARQRWVAPCRLSIPVSPGFGGPSGENQRGILNWTWKMSYYILYVLIYIILYYIILYYIILYYIILYYIIFILYYILLYYIILYILNCWRF